MIQRQRTVRVALVVPDLTGSGGVAAVVRFLYDVLERSERYAPYLISLAMSSRDRCSVRLLDPRSWLRGVEVRDGIWEGRQYRHVGCYLSELEPLRYLARKRLTRLLDEADIVQVVAGSPAWALVARRARAPVFLHVASMAGRERERRQRSERGPVALWRRLMTTLTGPMDRAGLRVVHGVFAMNCRVAELAGQEGDPGRVVLAPPGVDTKRFRPCRPEVGSDGTPYILSVGRLSDPRKNIELLFRAYACLLETDPAAPALWLAGLTAPPDSAWRLARSLGIGDRARYLGPVPDEELPELYRGALFFVLPSDEEGFGLVLVEAMASGLPVVSTDCGGPGEIVVHGKTGFLVPRDDAGAMTRAMVRLLESPDLRRRMGHEARTRAEEHYSVEVAARPFLERYDTALGASADRSHAAGRGGGRRSLP